MSSNAKTSHTEKITFTLRMDRNMNEIVEFLQGRTRLSKTAVIILAISNYYNQEISRESQIKGKKNDNK